MSDPEGRTLLIAFLLSRFPRLLQNLDLELLDLGQPLPLPAQQVVYLLVQMADFDLRLQVHLVVVERAEPVLCLLPLLAHHDDRRLHGSEAGQQQIEQDERIDVEGPGIAEPEIDSDPDD